MWRYLVGAGAIAAGVIAYNFMTSISEDDVYAYHDFERSRSSAPMQAGDIVAIRPDGLAFERICDLNLPASAVEAQPLSDFYYNTFDGAAEEFRRVVVGWLPDFGVTDDDQDPVPRRRLTFEGQMTSMREVEQAPTARDCECRMAARINRREPVCTIKQSLVATELQPDGEVSRRTVAVTLASWSNQVPAEVFAACGMEMGPAAAPTMGQPCLQGAALPVDVALRKALNAIRREPRVHAKLTTDVTALTAP